MIFLLYSFIDVDEKTEFSEIYKQYKNLVYCISYNISKNKFDAEDATSETFYRLAKYYDKLSKIKKEDQVFYISTVAKNTALYMYRQNSRQKNNISYEDNENFIAEKPDEYERLIQRIEYSEMLMSLNDLPEKQKIIFLYKYYFELSTKEIAKKLHTNENTISVSLHRAKKKLLYYIKSKF